MQKETLCLQWCFINALVIIIRMYTVSALFDITVPFFGCAKYVPPPLIQITDRNSEGARPYIDRASHDSR